MEQLQRSPDSACCTSMQITDVHRFNDSFRCAPKKRSTPRLRWLQELETMLPSRTSTTTSFAKSNGKAGQFGIYGFRFHPIPFHMDGLWTRLILSRLFSLGARTNLPMSISLFVAGLSWRTPLLSQSWKKLLRLVRRRRTVTPVASTAFGEYE